MKGQVEDRRFAGEGKVERYRHLGPDSVVHVGAPNPELRSFPPVPGFAPFALRNEPSGADAEVGVQGGIESDPGAVDDGPESLHVDVGVGAGVVAGTIRSHSPPRTQVAMS